MSCDNLANIPLFCCRSTTILRLHQPISIGQEPFPRHSHMEEMENRTETSWMRSNFANMLKMIWPHTASMYLVSPMAYFSVVSMKNSVWNSSKCGYYIISVCQLSYSEFIYNIHMRRWKVAPIYKFIGTFWEKGSHFKVKWSAIERKLGTYFPHFAYGLRW